MKKHGNTLYILTQGTYLARERETLAVRVEKKTRHRFPVHIVDAIVCFGNVSISPFALGLCGENGVAVSFLSETGRFLARLVGPVSGNVLLRRAQYRASDDVDGQAADIARSMVTAKVANARASILRALRDRSDPPRRRHLQNAADGLADSLQRLQNRHTLDSLRGIEGDAADTYFRSFDHLITSRESSMRFTTRSRRPPRDNINAVLSFLYAILANDVRSACESVGLDPQVGLLHRDRPGRPSLALDLMEELRPVLADRVALSLINRQQIKPSGFHKGQTGGVEMDDKTRKTVIQTWQKRKDATLTHPFLQEKTTVGLIPHIQARLLARHLRGDLEQYPPFFWK